MAWRARRLYFHDWGFHAMAERPDNSQRHKESSGYDSSVDPGLPGRTPAAGRAFLAALRADAVDLSHRLRSAAARARQRTQIAKAVAAASTTKSRVGLPRVVVRLVNLLAVVTFFGSVAAAGAMIWALHDLPPEKPVGGSDTPSLALEAANGTPMGRIGPFKTADARRADFPDDLVKAVIGIEDRHFYNHWGFDIEGIIRAFQRDTATGSIVEGGSTITQQLVKMRFLGHERTFLHKLREVLVAAWLDFELGKDEILTRYLNSVYLGNGAYGMAAAARLYFGKRLSELTLPEAAMLAGIIKAPSRDNPVRNPDAAQARAAVVVNAMRDNGMISAQAANDAIARPAVLHVSRPALRAETWFADWIAKQAASVPGSFSGHMRLRTTLMPDVQKLAEQAVAEALDGDGAARHVSQASLVAMRPDGAVVAMVGGRDYAANQFNRAVDSLRQPGSAFKLFVYLAALRKGFSPDDTIDASPLDVNGWEPENFGDHQYGRVSLSEAFSRSINTAAVRLAQDVGLNEVIKAARDLGLSGPLPAVPSLALGVADVSLLDLTAAYAAVKAGRMPIKPWGISGFGVEGDPRLQSMGPLIGPMQTLEPYQKPLLALLQGVVEHGTGRAAALDGFAAGKTGTSQNFRDAWFIGFNDTLVVGVWVGNDDDTPTDHVVGGSLPAVIWKRFMTGATPLVAASGPTALEPLPDTGQPDANRESATQTTANQTSSDGACDYQACAHTYSSFRAADCTYQPYGESGRRRCVKNAPQQQTASEPLAPNSEPQPSPGKAQCNVSACANFYSSFDAASCTYQPYDGGPRRMCEK
jgi:penicillin-binding protein 1A